MTLYALRKAATEAWLTEVDPDWAERFFSDWQRAEEHYRRRPSRVIHHQTATQPAEFAKPDRDESDDGFDTDLDGEGAR